MIHERYGKLRVAELWDTKRTAKGAVRKMVRCECDCGGEKIVRYSSLKSGNTTSCGCTQHGLSHTKEWKAWAKMKARCYNIRNNRYHLYGGRGIKVCDEWKDDFLKFYWHIGPAPSEKHSVDRIDPDLDYQPGNVRWATAMEQRHNQRRCRNA